MKHIFELRMKDQIEERSSQLLRNLSSCEKKAWKKFRLERDPGIKFMLQEHMPLDLVPQIIGFSVILYIYSPLNFKMQDR